MKKPVNFASVLFIAAALGLWAWQQVPAADPVASLPRAAAERAALR
jgi:hypothetical protein